MDPVPVVVTASVAVLVAEALRVLAARALGDDTATRVAPWWRLDRYLDVGGTVIVPALLAIASTGAVGWARPAPVRRDRLRGGSIGVVAVEAVRPAVHALVLVLALLVGTTASAAVGVPAALLLAVQLLPLPPVAGGLLVRALLPRGAARTRWDRWRRGSPTPWLVAAAALVAVSDVGQVAAEAWPG